MTGFRGKSPLLSRACPTILPSCCWASKEGTDVANHPHKRKVTRLRIRNMGFAEKYKRGLLPRYGNRPLKASQVLETQLQTKLQVASIQSTGGLAEFAVGNLVVSAAARSGQDEVGPVEYVESLSLKLKVYAFGEFEDLGEGHVG